MGRKLDLTGKKYGRLTVLKSHEERTTKGGYKMTTWECICDCGNKVVADTQSLRNGNTRSCGCLLMEDLTGQKFGKLTVLRLSPIQNHGKCKRWICKCDCGNTKIVESSRLKSGHTSSCGCIRAKDIEGKRFGRLTVIRRTEKRDSSGNVYWLCKCDCGNEIETQGRSLRKGLTLSCGCYHNEKSGLINKKHGKSRTRVYTILSAMKSRCYYEADANYFRYGGRGIKICDEWLGDNGFSKFYEWSMMNGYKENLTIERIDVDKDYEPNNCRWATSKEQMQNTRRSRYVEYEGEIYSISELSEKLNLTYMKTWHRFRDKSFGMDELNEKERIKRGNIK